MEDPCWSRFRAGPVARGEETMQEQVTWQELLPMGDPGWSSLLLRDGPHGTDPYLEKFWKSCCLWEACTGSVHQGLHPVGGTPQHRGQAAQKKRYRLTITPIPLFPCTARREEVEEHGRGGRRFWFLSFVSHFSRLLVISNKSYCLPMPSLFCPLQ